MREDCWSAALRADIEEGLSQVTVPRIATALGKSDSYVYQALRGEKPFALAFLKIWYDLTGAKHLMRWAGRVTNHWVAPIPIGRLDDMQYSDLLREFSEAVAEYTAAVADGNVTRAEAKAVRCQLDDLIMAAHRLGIAMDKRATTVPLRPATMAEAEQRRAE